MPTSSQPTFKLGRFEIVRELGRGAFGTVYLARDPQLERSVALKLPNVRFKERAGHEDRFLREARAAAGLHHPNIVPIHDAGQLGDHYYIAAAFIEGGTLRDILRSQGRPAPTTAVRLVARLADALGYAHSQGIVHRDVKPENVLLDSNGTPYLTDFGLARRLEEEKPTERRSLFGTPGYMSPEQAAGLASGAPADQWALGIMLYELLTGQRPFEGDPLTVLYAIGHTDIAPPCSLVPDLPLDLQAICLKCLSKAPENRYADGYALAADLERWLADEPVHARPLTLPQRIYRWNRREPVIARLYVAFLLTVTIFSLVLSILGIQALRLRNVANSKAAEAVQNLATAKRSQEELKETNTKLVMQQKDLEEKEEELKRKVEERDRTVEALQAAKAATEEAEKQKSQAQKSAEKAELLSLAEQAKNSKFRYFGDILGAGMSISSGQADRALAMLAESNTAERSIEWNFLSNLAHSINRGYNHIVTWEILNSEQTYSIISRHFPPAASDEQHIRLLRNSKDVLAVSDNAKRWLAARGTVEVLKEHLPPGTHQPRDQRYPDGPVIEALDVVATEFGGKAIMAQEKATHAWLSPDGKRACFMLPTIQKRAINNLEDEILIRFQLSLMDLDLEEAQGRSLMLVEPTTTSYTLAIRKIVLPGAKDGYRVVMPDMKSQFCGAFSPDSSKFVLYNAQSSQMATWDVSSLTEGNDGRKPLVSCSIENPLTAPCDCHFRDTEIQLCIPGRLIELEAGTLTVQKDRALPPVAGAPAAVVFSHSGRHVAQLCTLADKRNGTTLWVQLNNCLADLSQNTEIGPDRLTYCADASNKLKQVSEDKRSRLLLFDWKNFDLIDDDDGEWLSLRLPTGTQLLFEEQVKPEPQAKSIWQNPSKRLPLLLKSTANDDSILLAYEDRLVILKRGNADEKWQVQSNRDLKDGALLDAEFHAFQDSVLVCQPKGMSIFSRSNYAKPGEFPLPFKSSLAMASERTLAFLNEAGELQLASIDGMLGNRLAVHRLGSSCMAVDPQRRLAAVASSERTISRVNLTKLSIEAAATTREIPERLVLNLSANLLCSIGLASQQVSLHSWPDLKRVATFNINNRILYATPSNDGKRLIVVTPAGFQILDNQFAVPVLDTQKFAKPAVAAKVTKDQSAIFVYTDDGQLLKYQL